MACAARLVGKALVVGFLLGRALRLLGDPLDPLLGVLGLFLGLLYEVVARLAHHLVFLGGLGDGEPDGRPEPGGQGAHGEGVLP